MPVLKYSLHLLMLNLNCCVLFPFLYDFSLFCGISYSQVKEGEFSDDKSTHLKDVASVPPISLARKKFSGRYAVSSEEFTGEMVRFQNAPHVSVYICIFLIHISFRITCLRLYSQVGAKSRNIAYLKGKVASWIGIPTSVAIPFGVFEHVLSDKSNQVLYTIFLPICFHVA